MIGIHHAAHRKAFDDVLVPGRKACEEMNNGDAKGVAIPFRTIRALTRTFTRAGHLRYGRRQPGRVPPP